MSTVVVWGAKSLSRAEKMRKFLTGIKYSAKAFAKKGIRALRFKTSGSRRSAGKVEFGESLYGEDSVDEASDLTSFMMGIDRKKQQRAQMSTQEVSILEQGNKTSKTEYWRLLKHGISHRWKRFIAKGEITLDDQLGNVPDAVAAAQYADESRDTAVVISRHTIHNGMDKGDDIAKVKEVGEAVEKAKPPLHQAIYEGWKKLLGIRLSWTFFWSLVSIVTRLGTHGNTEGSTGEFLQFIENRYFLDPIGAGLLKPFPPLQQLDILLKEIQFMAWTVNPAMWKQTFGFMFVMPATIQSLAAFGLLQKDDPVPGQTAYTNEELGMALNVSPKLQFYTVHESSEISDIRNMYAPLRTFPQVGEQVWVMTPNRCEDTFSYSGKVFRYDTESIFAELSVFGDDHAYEHLFVRKPADTTMIEPGILALKFECVGRPDMADSVAFNIMVTGSVAIVDVSDDRRAIISLGAEHIVVPPEHILDLTGDSEQAVMQTTTNGAFSTVEMAHHLQTHTANHLGILKSDEFMLTLEMKSNKTTPGGDDTPTTPGDDDGDNGDDGDDGDDTPGDDDGDDDGDTPTTNPPGGAPPLPSIPREETIMLPVVLGAGVVFALWWVLLHRRKN